jgi:UDP-N-acetylglucosamine 3-dehydrogenase
MIEVPLRVGIIGAGNMGRHHVRILSQMGGVTLVGVADAVDRSGDYPAGMTPPWFASAEAMLDAARPDAVVVATPTGTHLPLAALALRAGCHVLVEKPIASTLREATELADIAVACGRILTVGHVERYNPVVRRLVELVREGALGEISSVVARRVGGFPPTEPATDVVVDLAVHDIDILNFLLGTSPQLLSAHGSRTFHTSQIDSVEMLIGYGRASGFVQANWVTPMKIRTLDVTGSLGYVQANYVTQELTWYEVERPTEQPDFASFVERLGRPGRYVERVALAEPLAAELAAFAEAARSGDCSGLVTPAEATDALGLALEAVGQVSAGAPY